MNEKNYKKIVAKLQMTEREGINELISHMEEIGYFTAPASGGHHLHEEGGLAQHSLNVLKHAEAINKALGSPVSKNELTITALLHDLGKCGDHGKPLYVENMIKDGRPTKAAPEQRYKRSEAKPYARNPELLPIAHAERSLYIANRFIDLTENEEHAIRYHDGLYDIANAAVKGHETDLYLILHFADLWASRKEEGSI